MSQSIPEKYLLAYLRMQTPKQNRGNILFFVLMGLLAFGVLPLAAQPFSPFFFWLGAIPACLLTLMAIPYVFAPYKLELYYYFLTGMLGIVTSFTYTLVVVKYLYAWLQPSSWLLFIGAMLFFVLQLFTIHVLNAEWIRKGTYYKLQKKPSSVNQKPFFTLLIAYFVFLIIVSILFIRSSSGFIVLMTALSGLQWFFIYLSTYFHRWMMITRHMELVKRQDPDFGLPLKSRRFRYFT